MNTRKRGKYYLNKSREMYKAQGYNVELLEHSVSVYTPSGVIPMTKDILHSDLLIHNKDRLALVQVKGGKVVTHYDAKKNYEKLRKMMPDSVELIINVWRPYKKEPLIYNV